MRIVEIAYRCVASLVVFMMIPVVALVAVLSRFRRKKIDIGLGPEPLINNVYHRKALALHGYAAQTFVNEVYFVTDEFDVRGDRLLPPDALCGLLRPFVFLRHVLLLALSLWRYRCLYIYFNGGPLGLLGLGLRNELLRALEPLLFRLAGLKVVVMPYGGDVQDMSRSPNPSFKYGQSRDYPMYRLRRRAVAAQVDRWTAAADCVISGCEWVDYMYYWDRLTLGHFSIDVDLWKPARRSRSGSGSGLRILHAPNHKAIKGTRHFVEAVEQLVAEGLDVELVLLQGVPNDEIRRVMATVDIVADQLVIGWYAMFALEAMAMEKPVLCYLRDDLVRLYETERLIDPDEIPIVNCSPLTVRDTIRRLAQNRSELTDIGKRSREYVVKHHSTHAMGKVFDEVNRAIGIEPRTGEEDAR